MVDPSLTREKVLQNFEDAAKERRAASTKAKPPQRAVLLPNTDALCDAFYHVKDTPEANVAQQCLRGGGACYGGKTTCLIARLVGGDVRWWWY